LICTRAIERIDEHLAFDIGGQRDPGHVNEEHWNELARQCDVAPRFVRNLVSETANALIEKLEPARKEFETLYGEYPALQRIEHVIHQQCRIS